MDDRTPHIVVKSPVIETDDVIYFDYSILSTFRHCNEKSRLAYEKHYQSKTTAPPLDFGGAFHAGVAGLNIAVAKNMSDPLLYAKNEFLNELRVRGGSLPINMEGEERRSVERGIRLLECYWWKYQNELYEQIMVGDKPWVEIGFSVFVMEWHGKPVMFVGRIDAIKRSRTTGRYTIFETKTTTSGLSYYIQQVKPNHQITGYHWVCQELLGLDVRETIWDCVFVSDRKPDIMKGEWMEYGIDPEKDFSRTMTTRTPTDVEEFLFDLQFVITEYLRLRDMNLRRWTRNAPGACHQYGGCVFREVCRTNMNQTLIDSNFRVERWEPWRGITAPKK